MDAVGMETLAHSLGLGHKRTDVFVFNHDVGACDGLLLVQAPDVELVDTLDARDFLQVVLDIVNVDATRSALEQDVTTVLDEGKC